MISNSFLQSCQAGDEEAIETLVRTYQRAVFQLALSILDDTPVAALPAAAGSAQAGHGEPPAGAAHPGLVNGEAIQEAEAATRETFMTAIDHLGSYREDTSFENWIYAIAIQVSRRRYWMWKVRRGLGKLWRSFLKVFNHREPVAPTAGETMQRADARFVPGDAAIWASICGLKMSLRLPVVLRYYHDLPISEVARVLHLSEGAVHARLDAAREKIALAANH